MKGTAKKLCALAIIFGLFAAIIPMTSSALEMSQWAKPSYEYLDSKKIIPVKLRDANLKENISRLEFTQLMVTYLSSNKAYDLSKYNTSKFTDIDDKFVNLANSLDIAAGYNDGTFKPASYITRAEAASIAFRVEKIINPDIKGSAPNNFSDKKFIPNWAAESIGYMAKANIVNGFPDGSFGASKNITRQEAIVITEKLAKTKSASNLTDIYDFVKDDEYMKKSEYEFVLNNIPQSVKFKQNQIKQAVFDTEKDKRQSYYNAFMKTFESTDFSVKTSPNLAFKYDMSVYIFGIESKVNTAGKTEQRVFMASLTSDNRSISVDKEKSYGSWFTVQ